jgi:hypothetical protein
VHRLYERLTQRSELERSAATHEQRIVEYAPQPGQCRAHRRLANPHCFRGARHMSLVQQRAERGDQVEISATQHGSRVHAN